jgi:hypothetical protein
VSEKSPTRFAQMRFPSIFPRLTEGPNRQTNREVGTQSHGPAPAISPVRGRDLGAGSRVSERLRVVSTGGLPRQRVSATLKSGPMSGATLPAPVPARPPTRGANRSLSDVLGAPSPANAPGRHDHDEPRIRDLPSGATGPHGHRPGRRFRLSRSSIRPYNVAPPHPRVRACDEPTRSPAWQREREQTGGVGTPPVCRGRRARPCATGGDLVAVGRPKEERAAQSRGDDCRLRLFRQAGWGTRSDRNGEFWPVRVGARSGRL